jgi:hypothetical protein
MKLAIFWPKIDAFCPLTERYGKRTCDRLQADMFICEELGDADHNDTLTGEKYLKIVCEKLMDFF